MLYNYLVSISIFLSESYLLQVFFRIGFVFISAFSLSFFAIKRYIRFVHAHKLFYQPIRSDGPQSHLKEKKNIPTMGGAFIILAVLLSCILFANIYNPYLQIILFVMTSFAAIGFYDDYCKVTKKSAHGFRGSVKFVIQFFIVSLLMLFLKVNNSIYFDGLVIFPFVDVAISLGAFYVIFATIVIVGSANAVNLTDGLDGLVSVPTIISFGALAIIIYLSSNFYMGGKVDVTNIGNIAQLIMFCAAFIGAVLAFLCFNLKPAKIFMGDVGSLAIGASLGALAVILKKELLFFVIGFLFVIEAMSVILQVGSYKLRKKRIFLMAPIHHHFEKMGWPEIRVVRFFWLLSLLFACLAMLDLIF